LAHRLLCPRAIGMGQPSWLGEARHDLYPHAAGPEKRCRGGGALFAFGRFRSYSRKPRRRRLLRTLEGSARFERWERERGPDEVSCGLGSGQRLVTNLLCKSANVGACQWPFDQHGDHLTPLRRKGRNAVLASLAKGRYRFFRG